MTLDDLLDTIERVLSPEALAAIDATPEPELLSFASGVFLALARSLDQKGWEERDAILAARGVPHWDDQKVFVVTALARRRRGRPLDIDEQLAAARQASRRRREEIERWNREHGEPGRKVHADQAQLMDVIFFARGTARLEATQDQWFTSLPRTLLDSPELQLVEVRGHAEAGERDGLALSRVRARAIVDRLVAGGVPASRLTRHGLGATCPYNDEHDAKRLGRDRRVDFVILKRPYLAPVD